MLGIEEVIEEIPCIAVDDIFEIIEPMDPDSEADKSLIACIVDGSNSAANFPTFVKSVFMVGSITEAYTCGNPIKKSLINSTNRIPNQDKRN